MSTTLGKQIRHSRLEQDKTLKWMADQLGVSSSFLSAVELGKAALPSEWPEKIADLLGMSQDERRALYSAAEAHKLERSGSEDDFDVLIRNLTVSRHSLSREDLSKLGTLLQELLMQRKYSSRSAA